ncbi:hypothetical protein LJC58_06330 [Lachnospiraceae bacterium OttesenSCG-928-D06]|nr:hypothetical protein [Lachnospiraceae bacterium OttesenSCG-928-D06]
MKYFLKRRCRTIKILHMILSMIIFTGCAGSSEYAEDKREAGSFEVSDNNEQAKIETEESVESELEEKLIPLKAQWQQGDKKYDSEDTIYYKNFYDDFVRGFIMYMEFWDVNLQEEMEDYFFVDQNTFDKMDRLVDMFFDYRTIEMDEEELKALFYDHGYEIYFHNAEIHNLHVRFVEIGEIGGLSLYPTRILMQTWDAEHIYLQDITGPLPRKIRSLLVIDDKEAPQLIVHSSGVSLEYVSEEELSFWTYRGTYWVLAPIELEIDTSHAHSAGSDLYPDMDRDTLFEATYYRDGITYRPSRQGDGQVHHTTYRLGKMQQVEKNKCFRLIAIYENVGESGKTSEKSTCYIEFTIK